MRGSKSGGKPSKITPEIASLVGQKVGGGLKIKYALATFDPPIPLPHWQQSLLASAQLRNAYATAEAREVETLLNKIKNGEKLAVPQCWLLERAHGYAVEKAPAVSVNFQTIVGIDEDIVRRARQLVPKLKPIVEIGPPKNKLLPDG